MKTLYIVRHTKAVDQADGVSDFERPLSDRGRQEAQIMAEQTQAFGLQPDQFISSPAQRAFETAHAFAQVYQYPVAHVRTYPCLYHDMRVDMLLQLVQQLDETSQTVMIFGHAPLCCDSVRALAPTADPAMPPGAVVCLQFHVSAWTEVTPGRGVVIWSHDPKRKRPADAKPAKNTTKQAVNPLQRPEPQTLQPTTPFDPSRLATALQRDVYTVQLASQTQQHVTYFDTFDWRLYNQSLALKWEAPHLTLDALSGDTPPVTDVVAAVPPFATDLPSETALRRQLESISGIRALQPLVDCASRYDTWRVLNADDKTVARLVIERHTCTDARTQAQTQAPTFTRLCLKPLKGYAKEAQRVQTWLLAHDFIPSCTLLYAQALAVLGITPNDYTAKPQFQLDPEMRGDAAMRRILRFLFAVMRRNEAGILNDIDTEFLHDFRVASRRARSAVTQVKGVFSDSVQQPLKQDLASLGAMTNRVRDLDVYLLRQADYHNRLPDYLQGAIEPLFDMLKRDRKQAFRSLVRKLRAKTYADLMTRWETFLDADTSEVTPEPTPNAARPILKIAKKRLSKMAARVVEAGHATLAHMDDEHLHELRIDCKKLRYLLEFFSSLFPPSTINPVIKRLRKLQDELGDFNDCCVQQQFLEAYVERFSDTEATQQAIAHLIATLEAEKQAFKAAFPDRFRLFSATVSGRSQPWKRRADNGA